SCGRMPSASFRAEAWKRSRSRRTCSPCSLIEASKGKKEIAALVEGSRARLSIHLHRTTSAARRQGRRLLIKGRPGAGPGGRGGGRVGGLGRSRLSSFLLFPFRVFRRARNSILRVNFTGGVYTHTLPRDRSGRGWKRTHYAEGARCGRGQ